MFAIPHHIPVDIANGQQQTTRMTRTTIQCSRNWSSGDGGQMVPNEWVDGSVAVGASGVWFLSFSMIAQLLPLLRLIISSSTSHLFLMAHLSLSHTLWMAVLAREDLQAKLVSFNQHIHTYDNNIAIRIECHDGQLLGIPIELFYFTNYVSICLTRKNI